jgi:hypothetical protein
MKTQKFSTIIDQLGGSKFIAMTGAFFMTSGESLIVKFKGSNVNSMTICINSNDTYSVRFDKIRGLNYKTIKEISEVFANQLQEVFTNITGLKTSL